MRSIVIPVFFGITLAAILVAFVFRIQHWPGTFFMLMSGFVSELVFTLFVLLEISNSQISNMGTKVLWIAMYCVIPLGHIILFFGGFVFVLGLGGWLMMIGIPAISGAYYLLAGRRVFVPKPGEIDKIKFDSF